MAKKAKTGAAPVSKYAAKKAACAIKEMEETEKVVVDIESKDETPNSVNEQSVIANTVTSEYAKKKDKKAGLPPTASIYPEHIVAIALIIKNNAEIRRFTALGILNYLLQKGEIKGDKRYVSFKWNKFAVKCSGLMREFSYNEPFFLNALVASFSSFSASAQRTIDAFCKKEMSVGVCKAVDREEVENIIALNEEYQGNDIENNEN